MESEATRGILRDIHTLYTVGTMGGRTDAELLERFLARQDSDAEDAFETLVARHGPMVRSCSYSYSCSFSSYQFGPPTSELELPAARFTPHASGRENFCDTPFSASRATQPCSNWT